MDELTLIATYQELWIDPDWRNRNALLSDDVCLSYYELAVRVKALAGSLVALGLKPGETVALSMARTGDSVTVLLAILFAGGSVCPLEPRISADEVAKRLKRICCRWAVTDKTLEHQFSQVNSTIAVIDRARLDDNQHVYVEPARVTLDTPALVLFTSGSTGIPKAVQLTQRAIAINAKGLVKHTHLTATDCLLHVMPIYHTNAINNQILAPFLAGATVAFAPRFSAADMPGLMARYQPTIVSGVPTMYSRMLAYSFDENAKINLRMIRSGSAPISPDLHQRIETTFGCPVVVSYGLSEATCTSTMNPPGNRRIGSVGTTLKGQTVVLLETERDVPVAEGVPGEIAIAGDSLMSGYLNENGQPDPSSIASGWLRTGDLGRFDEEGYLFITGRIKDVIIRGGENISPGIIEDVITADSTVESCCVVGRPDTDFGEVPVAFVVARVGAIIDAERLKQSVGEQLSRIYRPEVVFVVDSLPENSVGKVDRKALANQLANADKYSS